MYIEKSQFHGTREFILEDDCIRINKKAWMGDNYSLTYDYSSLSKNPSEQRPLNQVFPIAIIIGIICAFIAISTSITKSVFTMEVYVSSVIAIGLFFYCYIAEARKLIFIFQNNQGVMLLEIAKSNDEFESFINDFKERIIQSSIKQKSAYT